MSCTMHSLTRSGEKSLIRIHQRSAACFVRCWKSFNNEKNVCSFYALYFFFLLLCSLCERIFGHWFSFSDFHLWLFHTFFFTLVVWPQGISIILLLITHIPNNVNIVFFFCVKHFPPFHSVFFIHFRHHSVASAFRFFSLLLRSLCEKHSEISRKMIDWHAINTTNQANTFSHRE